MEGVARNIGMARDSKAGNVQWLNGRVVGIIYLLIFGFTRSFVSENVSEIG